MSFHDGSWDDVDTGRWIRDDDRERLDKKLARQAKRTKNGTGLTRQEKVAFVRDISRDLGYSPGIQDLADTDGPYDNGESYLVGGRSLAETLRAASVPTVEDVVVQWIRDNIADSAKGTFFARDIEADTGISAKRVAKALGRLRDGEAITAKTPRFAVAEITQTQAGHLRWGIRQGVIR